MIDNIPEDVVPRKGLDRDTLFNLDRIAGQVRGGQRIEATVTEPGKPVETPDGVPLGVEAGPPPVTAIMAIPAVTLADLRAAKLFPRNVPNLRVIGDSGERIQ